MGRPFRPLALAASACLALAALSGCDREPQAADRLSAARSGCLGCHAADKGVLFAPPFAAISERYAGNRDAAALLAESVRNGSHGKWAEYRGGAMPPQSQLSDEEARALVRSLLNK